MHSSPSLPIQPQELPQSVHSVASSSPRATHFDLICALAELRSLRAAAARLRLSQAALSRQLQQLEQRMGVAVVDRMRCGVRLTPTGERLLALAQSVLRIEEQWVHSVHEGRQLRGDVRIGRYSSAVPCCVSR